jgi:pyrroline-5-carboxylate reductase
MTVLGCGTMGIAILGGILSSLAEIHSSHGPSGPSSGTTTPMEEMPARLPTRFIACVKRPESAKKVRQALQNNAALEVVTGENVSSAERAGIVLLCCKPYLVEELLREKGMKEALAGKVLVSILAGVSVQQIEGILGYGENDEESHKNRCLIVRAMPNTAALIRESMTVIATSLPPLPPRVSSLVTWIFKRIGDVVYLPPHTMDACTALCGSGPAFFALMLEAASDGAVAMGLPRAEAQRMAAQTMLGAASLVLQGDHPALLRDKVSTPGGCTIGGLLVLEEGRVRGTVARAVREATVVASQLGQGVQGVNGTRFNAHQQLQ